jgi:F0F1-type ATP synthase beta subunit
MRRAMVSSILELPLSGEAHGCFRRLHRVPVCCRVLRLPLADLDAVLTCDQARAKQGLWPAIDPLRSHSSLLQADLIGDTHTQVATQAQWLLRRYADLHVIAENRGLDALSSADDREVVIRARRLHRFLTQPFSGAEPWTGTPLKPRLTCAIGVF